MKKVRFGKTNLQVSKIAFGGIPIQRLSESEAVAVVRGCIDLGVNFIDTANGYTTSEERIGLAIKGMKRDDLIIATKSGARDKKTFLEHLDLSLQRMGIDYIDVHQLHGISSDDAYDQVMGPGGSSEGLESAIKAGKVRFPAFSSHNMPTAIKLMKTEKFAATQLPFNFVDVEALDEAIPLAKKLDMGFIAMKPFGGGLLDNATLAIKYLAQFDNIVPDPGIETLAEMQEIAKISNANEPLTAAELAQIEQIKKEMSGIWCHRCDYCLPCPQSISISLTLNSGTMMKRMPFARTHEIVNPAIEKAKTCIDCRACVGRCPYDLDVPNLLKERVQGWDKYVSENK